MQIRPVTFHPVPVVRPAARVTRSPAEATAITALGSRPQDGEQPGSAHTRKRRRAAQRGDRGGPPPPESARSLATTLAVLALDHAFRR